MHPEPLSAGAAGRDAGAVHFSTRPDTGDQVPVAPVDEPRDDAAASPAVPFTIDADLDLRACMEPWLGAASGADVTIRRGGVPTALPDPEAGGVVWQHAGRRTLLSPPCGSPRGVRFLVEDGRVVRYETGRVATESDVRAFLLGIVWRVLGWQRGLLPLHASSVARGPDLHAFVGGAGAGKSTLAAALARHGYALFTDDVLLLDPASFDAGPLGHGHGDLRLCRRSMALTGSRADGAGRARRGVPKWYAVPVRSGPRCAGRLRTVHVLSYRNDCRVERLTGGRALLALNRAVYMPEQGAAIAGRRRILRWLAGVVPHTRVSEFHRRRFDGDTAWFHEDAAHLAAELSVP